MFLYISEVFLGHIVVSSCIYLDNLGLLRYLTRISDSVANHHISTVISIEQPLSQQKSLH